MTGRQNIKNYIYVFVITLFVIMMCFSSFSIHAQAKELSGTGKITAESLNVRSGPGKEFDAIGKMYASEKVTITGTENGWYRIDYNGAEGYVSASYVEMDGAEVIETEVAESSQQPATEEEEVETGTETGILQYKIPILLGVIVLVFIIIIVTLKGIRKLDDDDDDEYDDEYEEEDDDYEEDDDEEDDDDYEYERRQPSRTKSRQPIYTIEEPPVKRQSKPVRTQQQRPVKVQPQNQKELDLLLSNNPDDFRIDIDPIFFEDEKKESPRLNVPREKDADLQKALEKMEELQREIERIKNQK